jgi:hypothetical protein
MTLPASGTLTMTQINGEFGLGNNLGAYRGTVYYSGGTGPYYFPNTNLAFSNFYSTSNFIPLTITAYVIGGGGRSSNDTSGGSGGGGASIVQTTLTATVNTLTVVVGAGGVGGVATGGTSYVANANVGAYGYGGPGNSYGPPCGGCLGGNPVPGGGAAGGNLNLSGGAGSGYNQYYIACCAYQQVPGGAGASGTFNGVTYYAAGGGGGGSDLTGANPGGAGGSYAGSGGYGYYGGTGQAGNPYGGGSGGGSRNNGGTGNGANGIVVITYVAATQLGSGGVVSNVGTTWTHTFYSSGTFTAL